VAPLISVVIPTCDRHDMLQETLGLLRKQTALPAEVIVADNGAVPAALAWASYPFAVRHHRIGVRVGASRARNAGAAVAAGCYIAFLDDDDFWEADYLERLAALLARDPGAMPAMVVARIDHLDNGHRHPFRFAGDDPRLEPCFYFNPGYLGSAITVEKAAFLALGGFDAAFRTGEDKELAIRFMLERLRIVYDRELCAINRVHAASLSREIDSLTEARLLLQKHGRRVSFGVRMRTLREGYKKARKKRYFIHKLLLKLLLMAVPMSPKKGL